MISKNNLQIVILLLLISFPAVKALLIHGGFTSHDLTHHVIRQISMDKLLTEGQFPPRWSGELNNGYGYPVFLFNYPLPAMVGEIFHKAGFGFVDSVKAVLFVSMIASILGMHLFLRSLLNDKLAAFLGATFYLYAPIRFLNVYVSASVGSALALAIVPFVFWSLVLINKGKRGGSLVGGLSFAALILSHNVTTLIFAPVILAFAGYLIWRSNAKNELTKKTILMFLLGLGLSAWFWMPALIEKQYIRFDQVYSGFYKDQFVNFWQLIHSPWGYGLSHPAKPEPGDMSYQLGLIHIGVMLVLSSWFVVRGWRSKDRLLAIFAWATFVMSVFLMLKASLPLWETIPLLSLVQFPLRFSAVAVFAASIAAALLVKYLPHKKLLFIGFLLLVLYANRNHWHINQVFNPGDDYYLNLKTTSTSYGEHLPSWGRVMDKPAVGKLEFVSGGGEVKVIRDYSNSFLVEIEAAGSSQIRFNQFYFPGWEIKVDNNLVKFNYLSDGLSYGLPLFDIDAGKHLVEAQFKNTSDRNVADKISIITFITVIIIICRQLIRK